VPYTKPVLRNRVVGGIVVGVMLVMAATGLTYALMTVDVRRAHDKSLPRRSRKPFERFRKTEPELPEVVAAVHLPALGYLPPETNVVAGVQVEELLSSSAGKEMRQRGFKLGNVELKLDSIEERLGVAVEDIDHLVLGVQMQEGDEADLTPPTWLVIRTRRPYDANKVRAVLGAKRPRDLRLPGGGRRVVSEVKVQNVRLQMWLADPKTLVLGLFGKMEDLPARPEDGGESLSPEVRRVLEQRLGAGTPVWLAGSSSDWKKTALPVLLAGWKDVPMLNRLAQVRTFALWLQPDKEAKLMGAFRCADEAVARQIEEKDLAPRVKARPEAFTFSRDKEWLSMQMKIQPPGGDARK
jgi:hypothetical protein